MKEFKKLLSTALTSGIDQLNTRTNKICRAIVGYQIQFDISEYFPATTIRRMPIISTIGELLGFFRGYDNAEDFRKLKCGFWTKNANETETWLINPVRQGTDDLGRIYGKQWTDWIDRRLVSHQEAERLIATDPRYKLIGTVISGDAETVQDTNADCLIERRINQLEEALRKLITDPTDRRIIVSGWNVGELDLMALPPCHMDYKFVVIEGVLHCVMGIRSWDLYLGAPANIAETAIFTAVMARLAGYKLGTITIQATNAHLYENSFEATELLLKREPRQLPHLVLSDNIKQITDLADIKGAFERIEPSDIKLVDYDPIMEDLIDKNGNVIYVEMAA